MVQADIEHPSLRAYQKGCRCPSCRAYNTEACMEYRRQRKANGGLPLSNRNRKMPSLITRLRREIGIIVEWGAS